MDIIMFNLNIDDFEDAMTGAEQSKIKTKIRLFK